MNILHRHLVVVPGNKGGVAFICAEKYASDCKKFVGLHNLPEADLDSRLDSSRETVTDNRFSLTHESKAAVLGLVSRELATTVLARSSRDMANALPYLYLLPKALDWSREDVLRYRGIGGRSPYYSRSGGGDFSSCFVVCLASSPASLILFSKPLARNMILMFLLYMSSQRKSTAALSSSLLPMIL